MSDIRRIKEIISRLDLIKAEELKKTKRIDDELLSTAQLTAMWSSLFPKEITSGWYEEAADRFIAIVPSIFARNWHYNIGWYLLNAPAINPGDPCAEIVWTLWKYACLGKRSELVEALKNIESQVSAVARSSESCFQIYLLPIKDVPSTPALNRKEMAKVLGISHDSFRARDRSGQWIGSPDSPHFRRWHHKDPQVQIAALREIRNIFPEKIWSKRRNHR